MRVSSVVAVVVAVGVLVAAREGHAQTPVQPVPMQPVQPLPPTAPAPAATTPGGWPAPPPASTVIVHVESPSPVELQVSRGHGDWERVCTSPCDVAVRANDTYRVEGDDVPASEQFPLQPAQRATLKVEPSTKKSKAGGIVFTVLGAVGFAPGLGVTVMVVGAAITGTIFICPIATAFGSRYEQCLGDVAGYFTPAYSSPYVWAPAIAGVAFMGIGIAWLASSTGGHGTNVTTTTASATPPPPPPVLALPAWETTLRSEKNAAIAPPPANVFPLFGARF